VVPDDFPADSVIFFIAYGNATGFHDIRSTCPLVVGGMESQLDPKRHGKAFVSHGNPSFY
jgi:hypothetical protein